MDIPEKVNKAMTGEATVNKAEDTPTTLRAVSAMFNEYFFPGGGKWKPMSINATTREEAEALHKAKREPVSKEEPKVEDNEESTNNE